MVKKLLFFIYLVILFNLIKLAFAEIIPLKKPNQTKIEKEQKLLIDVLRPLPKPITKKKIEKDENKEKTEKKIVSKKEKKVDFILPKKNL